MNLVLVGFGGVARRFVDLLETQRDHLAMRYGFGFRVVGIATGRHGALFDADGIDTGYAASVVSTGSLSHLSGGSADRCPSSARELLAQVTTTSGDDNVVVVETTPLGLNSGQPGVDHVRMALTMGADVITANKGPAAFAFRELRDLADRHGRAFLFEGAVLDGLPVFSLLRHTLPAVRVIGFRGIVNTTTNHVLTAMESGVSIDDAVREMQRRGMAEADPSSDIDGWDAAAKTAALANALMDARTNPHEVTRESLRTVSVDDVRTARRTGSSIKLVASAFRRDGRVFTEVRPLLLDGSDPLARLSGTAKGLEIDTDLLGRIQISKSASGVEHTAYALLADLVEVARRHRMEKWTA